MRHWVSVDVTAARVDCVTDCHVRLMCAQRACEVGDDTVAYELALRLVDDNYAPACDGQVDGDE
jgi:hypothetical protein